MTNQRCTGMLLLTLSTWGCAGTDVTATNPPEQNLGGSSSAVGGAQATGGQTSTDGGRGDSQGGITSAGGGIEAGGMSSVGGTTATGGTTAVGGANHSVDPFGVYEDDVHKSVRVDAASWTIASDVYTFVTFDSKNDLAVALNGDANLSSPGKFSRFDWATDAVGLLQSCQTVSAATTAGEAAAAPRADESDWSKGCGGSSWTTLRGPAIAGAYSDGWGGTHTITGGSWTISGEGASSFLLLVLSNTERYLIAQNASTNSYSPDKFSRFDWAGDAATGLHYCQTAYAAASVAAALATAPADATDLAKGCAGFPWSVLTPDAP